MDSKSDRIICLNGFFDKMKLAAAGVALAGAGGTATAASLSLDGGWSFSVGGQIQGFLLSESTDASGGADSSFEQSSFQSGWNPSHLVFGVTAPQTEGLTVTGTVLINRNISPGSGGGSGETGLNARVLNFDVAGSFGTVSIGRKWSIFNSEAIAQDAGSALGVGNLCVFASPSGRDAPRSNASIGSGTCGKMAVGYTYSDFHAGIQYATPSFNGLTVRVGLFDPANPLGFDTRSPRVEAEATYARRLDGDGFKIWGGLLHQDLKGAADTGAPAATMSGFDFGTHVDVGPFGITGAFTNTEGFGYAKYDVGLIVCSATCEEQEYEQWYVEGTAKLFGRTTFGLGYGEGEGKPSAVFTRFTNEQTTAWIHHDLTKHLNVTLEYTTFKGANATTTTDEYSFIAAGAIYSF